MGVYLYTPFQKQYEGLKKDRHWIVEELQHVISILINRA